jgi:hypothetical protein
MRLPHRILRISLVTMLPVTGLLTGLTQSASASTHPKTSELAQATAIARQAIRQLDVGRHSTDQRVSGHAHAINGQGQVQSTNWSGYADTGSGFSSVAGNWIEPSATCPRRGTQLAAFWVGIDGYSSSTVEQDGTLIECSRGTAYQFTWWEMYPSNAIQTVSSALAPGDSISASVVRSGTSYTLTVTDRSHPAASFSTTQSCSNCANSSAEWIAEAPSSNRGVEPLADFGTWTESGATVSAGSSSGVISSFPYDEITMVDSSGLVKAQPSPLNSSGNGFTVTWERAS